MSLLKKASIITTPTAYAEDYLYSIKPAQSFGSELVTNGDFSTDSDWTKGTGWTISGGKAISNSAVAFQSLTQAGAISNSNGRTYKVKFTISDYSSGGVALYISGFINNSFFVFANGDYEYNLTVSSGTSGNVEFLTHSGGFIGSIDNVSVKKIENADFDFTRNSTGTRLNEDYLIEDVPYNLAKYSQNLSGGAWSNTNSSESLDTSILAPDGTATAWKLQASAATGFSFILQAITMTGQNTFSCFLKKGTSSTASMFFSESGNFGLSVNLDTGTITNTGGSDMTSSVESAGNGWYRFHISHTSGDDLVNQIRIGVADGAIAGATYAGTENIYVWGAQVTKGGIKDYLKTTDRLDIPRIDYTNGEPSIKLEPSRTNLIHYSNDFSDSNWIKQGGITATYNTTETLSPEGLNNASKFTGNGTNGVYRQVIVTGVVARSIYLKSVTGNVSVTIKDPVLTVTTKTLNLNETWQRFELIESNGHGSASGIWINDIPSSGIYMYGAQLEVGSYSTSLIHTSGSAVTRSEDSANNAGNSDLINSTEGVLYAEIKADTNDEAGRQITISDGSAQNNVQIKYTSTDNRIDGTVKSGNVTQANMQQTLSTVLEFHKVAVKYKANDCSFYVDGVQIATDTSATMPVGLKELSFDNGASGSRFLGKCKMIAVFKEALTDTELQCLTGYNNHELYMNYYNRLSYLGLAEEYNVESDINNYIL